MAGRLHNESYIHDNNSSTPRSSSSEDNESNVLSFLSSQTQHYNQLIDDLSIIDGMFTDDVEEEHYDKHVVDAAGDAALHKHRTLVHLARAENKYITDLLTFQEVYIIRVHKWFDSNKWNRTMTHKQQDLYNLFCTWDDLLSIHRTFVESLSNRMSIWGPTQLVSDVFGNLHGHINTYERYAKQLGAAIVSLDGLLRLVTFAKLVDIQVDDHDICYYLRIPLERITTYAQTIDQLVQHSVPSHPDYGLLIQTASRFRTLQFHETIGDVKQHLAVLEVSRAIPNCPATVTPTRRLLLVSPLVKVNLDNPSKVNDVRTYLLYNDMLIFCRRMNPKDPAAAPRLQYKGKLELVRALVRPILPQLAAEMLDDEVSPWARRPVLPTFTRKKSILSTSSSSSSSVTSPTASSFSREQVFGFEVLVPEGNADYMVAFYQNYNGHGPIVRRRHVLRAQSKFEQDTWLQSLRSVIEAVNTQVAQ